MLPDGKLSKIITVYFTRKSSQVQNILKSPAVGMSRTWVKCTGT